ncbi:MAG TPA: hypothetical protein VM348_04775 [Brevundimonas sp.]|nr:hypothetical protein [Brevundimonas sp.]
MNKAIIAIAATGLLASACASDGYSNGTNETVRQGAIGAGLGAVVGGAAGAIRGSQQDRANQQRYRDSSNRYYYCYDGRQDECYWENGQRRY